MHQIRAALGGALRALSAPALAALALAALPGAAAAQQEHGQHAPARKAAKAAKGADSTALLDGLGKHHYAITTSSPMAQRYFDQGLSLAYAFNHAEARRSFLEASRLDPACAMCQWGVALVLGPNINAPMDTAANAEAHAASRRAAALAEKATPVERALAEALTRRYAERPVADRAPLDSAYAAAMADVARRFPDDAEAGGGLMVAVVQLALSLGATAGGVVYDASGYRRTFALSAAALALSALVAGAARRQARGGRRPQHRDDAEYRAPDRGTAAA